MQTNVCSEEGSASSFPILYARLPGLLALAARRAGSQPPPETITIAVTEGKAIRDACPIAARAGIRVGEPVGRAYRLCPTLLVVPLEDIEARVLAPLSARFLEVIAAHTPTVEPDNLDAGATHTGCTTYADFTGGPLPDQSTLVRAWTDIGTGFAPVIGFGTSKNAARACAECCLSPDHLADADARWLWPEDPAIGSRLFRLGLTTYGAVTSLGEAALVYQFGKQGRLLYQRSVGRDFSPVRALFPLPRVLVQRDFALEPIENEAHLLHTLGDIAALVSQQLREQGHHARRLQLTLKTEASECCENESVLPAPLQQERDIYAALFRLKQQIPVRSPIAGITVSASDLNLPPAATGNLFESRAAERKLALAATRQRLHARYGVRSLRLLGELPLPRRETRRLLRKERQHP